VLFSPNSPLLLEWQRESPSLAFAVIVFKDHIANNCAFFLHLKRCFTQKRKPNHSFIFLWNTHTHKKMFVVLKVNGSEEEWNAYRFGTTWGWINGDRIFIFRWTISLRLEKCTHTHFHNSLRNRRTDVLN